ncbi:MAG: glycosyltransferase [Planctomycetes bacterium]|nr:glycosyltransferase [Planctomycetota bacterium]
MPPLFTVFIPNYNYSKFIGEAIQSVLNQTIYDPHKVEIVIVDDGSGDDSPLVVNRFKGNLHYVYKKKENISASWYTAITLARGKYFCILDSDDYWAVNKLEEVEKAISSDPVLIYHSFIRFSDLNGQKMEDRVLPFCGDLSRIEWRGHRLMFRCVASSMMVIKTEIMLKIGPVPTIPVLANRSPDGFYFFGAAAFGKVVAIDKTLSFYRLHGTNVYYFVRSEIKDEINVSLKAVLAKLYTSVGLESNVCKDIFAFIDYYLLIGGRSMKPFPDCICENLRFLRDFEQNKSLSYKSIKFLTCFLNKGAIKDVRSFMRL